jgi:hypothetical protein
MRPTPTQQGFRGLRGFMANEPKEIPAIPGIPAPVGREAGT